jgi:CBS domain-containing protein
VTSIAIGTVSLMLMGVLAGPDTVELVTGDPSAGLPLLSPFETLLFWLGPVNLVLGLFNLVPGFPLDGGRIFRAIVWWATGSIETATRWASAFGRAFALLLVAIGVAMAMGIAVPFFGVGLGSGLWLVLIGWFLYKAAHAGYAQLVMREAFRDVRVAQLMRRRFDAVSARASIAELVRNHILQGDQDVFPVVGDDDRLVGVVTVRDAMARPAAEWDTTPVTSILVPLERVPALPVDEEVGRAMRHLDSSGVDQLPVIEPADGTLRGLLRRSDVMRWLMVRTQRPAS